MGTEKQILLPREHRDTLELCLIRACAENSGDVFGEPPPELLTAGQSKAGGREMFLQLPQAWARHQLSEVTGT